MTVFLVRHADAKSRANWPGDDELRPLSRKGEAQARGLIDLLGSAPITRVLSSPAIRCRDTVGPLASKLGMKVEEEKVLLEGTDTADAYDLVRRVARKSGDSVLCTHGDVIPELLRVMNRDGLSLGDEPHWPKGSTWAIEADDHQFTKARYLAPPEG